MLLVPVVDALVEKIDQTLVRVHDLQILGCIRVGQHDVQQAGLLLVALSEVGT